MEDKLITPEYILSLNKPSKGYLCSITDNIYNLKFLHFRVRDLVTGITLFEVEDEQESAEPDSTPAEDNRLIRYHLGPDFLDLTHLGTSLKFSVGQLPVKNLLMIERHYFRDRLIKSFEFKFDFCLPNSVNTWETIYEVPSLDESVKEEMINNPWEVESDSFYFVDERLIMHHKALYNYSIYDEGDNEENGDCNEEN